MGTGEPPPEGVAWLWPGPVVNGYGWMAACGAGMYAHRYSYERWVGPIPKGYSIRHKNDTPRDVNPNNLLVGTHAENMADMKVRKRSHSHGGLRGEINPYSKLTDDQVLAMRELRRSGKTYQLLADQFFVSPTTAYDVCSYRSWKHIR